MADEQQAKEERRGDGQGGKQDRRRAGRKVRRVACEMEVAGKVHAAVIRDLTAQGVFVITRFDAPPGTSVTLRIRRPGGDIWEIQAVTARRSDGARGLISDRGMGLVIEDAPFGFHEFFAELRS